MALLVQFYQLMLFEWLYCFSYKISMLLISNDYNPSPQQQSNHNYPLLSKGILSWLRNQFIAISPPQLNSNSTERIARQFPETQFLIKLLLKINYQYFSQTELMDGCNCTGSKWRARIGEVLEKYVNYSERRRLARGYRNVLLFLDNTSQTHSLHINSSNNMGNNSQQSITELHDYNTYPMDHSQTNSLFSSLLLMLLLFLTTRSENNQQFISRILTLPIENQKQLQIHIEWVGEEMLQHMTEKQQLSIRFNQLQEENLILHQNHQQSINHNSKLIHQLQKTHKSKALLQNTIHQNNLQKLSFLQSLPTNHPLASSSYTSIFRHSINTNSLLNTLLQQKQRKHQQLLSLNKQINLELNSFEGVLEELGKERKCVKRELNQKENESFRLQMRASLKGNNGSIRKSCKFWNTDRSMREFDQNIQMTSKWRDSLLLTNSQQFVPCNSSLSEINQSMSMLSKIQELRRQKQALRSQLRVLKDENESLRRRQGGDERIFAELSELYAAGLRTWGESENNSEGVNGVKDSNQPRERSNKMSNNSRSELYRGNKENKCIVGSDRLRKEASGILSKANHSNRYGDEGLC